MSRLVALVPCYGGLDDQCDAALRLLEARGIAVWRKRDHAAIDQARSQMATDALAAGFDELLWIDGDIVFEPSSVDHLRALGEPLVAGLYAKKGLRSLACQLLPETTELRFGEHGGVIAVRYAGAGFLYTRAEVYLRMAAELPVCNEAFGQPFVPYFMPALVAHGQGHWYLGEDYAFCERASRIGYRVLADTRIRLFHAGRYAYGWEDAGRDVERFGDYRFVVEP